MAITFHISLRAKGSEVVADAEGEGRLFSPEQAWWAQRLAALLLGLLLVKQKHWPSTLPSWSCPTWAPLVRV